MAADLQEHLCHILRNCEFLFELNEYTMPDNKEVFIVYERCISAHAAKEELFFCTLIANFISYATDEAPAIIGKQGGFIGRLKQETPNIFTIHGITHRKHLVAKSLSERLHSRLA